MLFLIKLMFPLGRDDFSHKILLHFFTVSFFQVVQTVKDVFGPLISVSVDTRQAWIP